MKAVVHIAAFLTVLLAIVVAYDDYEVRLVNGTDTASGRVEVYHDGSWNTICGDHWDMKNANVVCRQLDWLSMASALGSAHFGKGTANVLRGGFDCLGNEMNLQDCPKVTYDYCPPGKIAGVVCNQPVEYDVRLVGGKNSSEGRVEVFYGGIWQIVCSDYDHYWDIKTANVVCRQLGFTSAVSAPKGAYVGSGTSAVFGKHIGCYGEKTNIVLCYMWQSQHDGDCKLSDQVGAVCSSPGNYDVRLADGTNSSGRVEVFYEGYWHTVCEDLWGLSDANVLCRELGFLSAASTPRSAYFGEGKGFILHGGFDCSGDEDSLAHCSKSYNYLCPHSQDAGAICNIKPVEYDVRLVDGKNSSEGRVEVFYNNTWQTVCSGHWYMDNANVVCRQLGFTSAVSASKVAYIGKGMGAMFRKDFNCFGYETNIGLCYMWQHDGDCELSDRAGAVCTSPDVRLVGGKNGLEGRVEAFEGGVWGAVCNNQWDIFDAKVVCQQLGYGPAAILKTSRYFGPAAYWMHYDYVTCQGFEEMLQDCPKSRRWTNCDNGEVAGIVCRRPERNSIRLVGGTSNLEGRVEVYVNNAWGTICDDNWNTAAANVVCRQLGYDYINSVATNAFGQGSGNIVYTKVVCSGSESRLVDCYTFYNQPWSYTHGEVAGVRCAAYAQGDVRLVDGPDAYRGRVEIFVKDQWGTICADQWSLNDAKVVCKQLGYSGADNAGSDYGRGTGLMVVSRATCYGYESRFDQCIHDNIVPCINDWIPASVDCKPPGTSTALSTVAVMGIIAGCICAFVLVLVVLIKLLSGRHRTISSQPATNHVPTVSKMTAHPQVHSVPWQQAPPSYSYYPKVPTLGPVAEDPPPSYSLGPAKNQNDSPSEHQYQTVQEPEDRRSTSNLLM